MSLFDTCCLVAGACMLTYWLILRDNPKKQDVAGMIAVGGLILVASGLAHHIFY